MKLLILNTIKELNNEQIISSLPRNIEVEYDYESKFINEVESLFKEGEKILAIDIDYPKDKYVGKDILSKIPDLKAVIISSTSFEWIDTTYLRDNGIIFFNTENFSSHAVAEWGVFMTLGLARKFRLLNAQDLKTDYSLPGKELVNLKVGIIGLGNIGLQFAKRIEGFSTDISYWSRSKKDVEYAYKSIEELIKTSDILYFSMVRDSDNHKLLKLSYLDHIKKDCIVTAATKPHTAFHEKLITLVNQNLIYGYGFESSNSFKSDKNIWSGPQMGWCTKESMHRNSQYWFENIKKVVESL